MKIAYLADHPHVIPTLAAWFYEEWAYLHPGRTQAYVEQTIAERVNKDKVPLALVAFEGSEPIGTVCLKVYEGDRHDLTPWLAGLYVAKPWRRRGVGAALVAAIEKTARELGIGRLYLYTPEGEHFYLKLEWQVKERTVYNGYPVVIMQKELGS